MTTDSDPRTQILQAAYEAVAERGGEYGDPHDNFTQVAGLWTAAFGVQFTARDIPLALALLKVARLVNGGGIDSWVDIAGYAACGGEVDVIDYNMAQAEQPDQAFQPVELDDDMDLPEPLPPTQEELDDFHEDLTKSGFYDAIGDPTTGFTVDGQPVQ